MSQVCCSFMTTIIKEVNVELQPITGSVFYISKSFNENEVEFEAEIAQNIKVSKF